MSRTSLSISFTTRAPRGEEVHGQDYYFITDEEFDRMIADDEFIEWAEVFGKRYGTGQKAVQDQLDSGVDVLLDIDVQGGLQIRKRFENPLLIFLLPPSMPELRRRLVNRATDATDVVERRLAEARREIEQAVDYDYLVTNDDFEQAAVDLRAIVRAHRMRQNQPLELVSALLSDA